MFKNKIAESFFFVDFSDLQMPMIVVYARTLDFPEHFVARIFDMENPTDTIIMRETLEGIREDIPSRFIKLERFKSDEPTIIEVWL